MKLKYTQAALFLFLSILLIPVSSKAQAWSGIIDPSRAVDWSSAGVIGGIPNRTTQCGSTIAAYSGSASTINSAIAACPAGQFVSLGAGTFNLTSGIDFSGVNNVTVRGQGANSTLLVFTGGGAGCGGLSGQVCLDGSNNGVGNEQNVCDWTAGYTPGTTTLTLANCGSTAPGKGSLSNLKVGTTLFLDQVDEAADTGTIWNCATEGVCGTTTQGGGARTDGPSVNGISQRSQQQGVTVTAISGSTITVSPAIYMPNWRTGQSPQAWFANTTATMNGIENVSVDNTNGSASHNFTLFNCYQCWVKGVRSLYAGRSHVDMQNAAHCTVQDSYFYQNQSHNTVSYGIEFNTAFDSLVQNNIVQQVTDSTPSTTSGAEGNVAAYNFGTYMVYNSSGWFQAMFYQHSSGDAMGLWEGNIGSGYNADDVHGTHAFETLFRNYLQGNQAQCDGGPCTAQTVPVNIYAGSRYFNIIGNVLGESGYHKNYNCIGSASSCGQGNTSIYNIGCTGNECGVDSGLNQYCLTPSCSTHGDYDPLVLSYLLRWGNYDLVNGTNPTSTNDTTGIRFVVSEIPSALAGFASAVPSTQTLPSSFYLSGTPSWWVFPNGTASPFPGIGPDVTSGGIANVGGHANMNPAMNCYLNVMGGPANGTGSALSFNAASCYGSSSTSTSPTQPAPPTGLTATVQ